MTSKQEAEMYNLLKLFKVKMEKFAITFSIYGGSLIGVHRHQGIIPWDDDIDLLVRSTEKQRLIKALVELNRTHALKSYDGIETGKWKFYKLDGKSFPHKPFRYPYLDIFFFKDNNKTTYKVENENHYFPKNQFFPLIYKNFGGIIVPTPCDTEQHLYDYYGNINQCFSSSYNHSTEHGISNTFNVTCDELKPFFPFTLRKSIKLNDRFDIEESLQIDSETIQIVKYSIPISCTENQMHFESNLRTEKIDIIKQ